MQSSVTLLQRRVGKLVDDDLHEVRDVGHDVLAADTSKFAKAHEDVSRNSRIRVVRLGKQDTEHGNRVRLDEALGSVDKESE